jgi:type IV pilus assembly protein PilA
MRRNKTSGFTLIELMIVVAIIGILAAIAIPNFIRYQLRSKTTEAKTVLGGIKTSQESFRAEYDNYIQTAMANPDPAGDTLKVGWMVAVCNAACNRLMTDMCDTFDCIGYQPAGDVYYGYGTGRREAMVGTTAEYAAGAQSDLDGDGNHGSFYIASSNDEALPGTVLGGAAVTAGRALGANCIAGTPPSEVQDCRPNVY